MLISDFKMKKSTSYSILELAIIPEGSGVRQALHNSLQLAQAAEEWGYKRFWLAEHHNSEHIASTATALLIGYIAENTTTIRVGSGGIMLPNHAPLMIAEQFGTLAHLYPGRIDLGLGRAPGTDTLTAQAIRSDFMSAARDFPNEVAAVERYFSAENRTSQVRAAIAEGTVVPLYILGSSTDSAHLAAAKGLPYAFASHFAASHLYEAFRIYREEFQPSVFLQKPYTIAGINAFVADTDAEAERLFTTLVKMFLSILTGKREGLQPPADMDEELRQLLHHPALDNMLRFSFVGSKATVKSKLKNFIAATDVDELITACATYNLDDRLRSVQLFAEVMDEINHET